DLPGPMAGRTVLVNDRRDVLRKGRLVSGPRQSTGPQKERKETAHEPTNRQRHVFNSGTALRLTLAGRGARLPLIRPRFARIPLRSRGLRGMTMRTVNRTRQTLVASVAIAVAAITLVRGQQMKPDAGRPVVAVEGGQLRGVVEDGIASFRGIPYAAPPIGA